MLCSKILKLNLLYTQVIDDDEEEEGTTNEEEIEAWKQKDVDARTYTYSTISPAQQGSLHGCTTAHEMWTRVKTEYAENSAQNVHMLTLKFMDYKYQQGSSLIPC